MPRTVSQETLDKIEYVKSLYGADNTLTRRDLNAAVKKKFKTGLAFGHMADVLAGGRRVGGPRKRAGAPGAIAARRGGPGKMAPVSDRIFAGAPAFLVIYGGGPALGVRTAGSKAAVKDEIAKLVSAGASPDDITVYARDAFRVETRPIVNMD